MPVGTVIRYRCPPNYKLDHDWYAPTVIEVECTALGTFTKREFWPKCIIRKNH